MKIDVAVQVSKSPKEDESKRAEWPVMPFDPDESIQNSLTVLFYNGTTELDPSEESRYAVMAAYDNETIIYDETYRLYEAYPDGHGGEIGAFDVRFVQNSHEYDTDAITTSWKLKEDYDDGRELLEVIDRQALELLREPGPTEPERKGEDAIFRLGVGRPNLSVSLIMNEQVLGRADLLSVWSGDVPVTFATGIDSVADTDKEPLGYTWPNLPARNFHLLVEERTAKSKRLMLRSNVERETWPDYFAYAEETVLEFEGVHWNWFDTSLTDQFKVTEKPEYTADAITGPPVNLLQVDNILRVFVFPRRWWFFNRFRVGDKVAGGQDTCYGIWALPPREHMIPEPREGGCWQVGCPATQILDDGGIGGELDLTKDSNAFLEWTWEGDTSDSNAYWFLDYREGNTTRLHPGPFSCVPGAGIGDHITYLWYTMRGDPEDSDLSFPTCQKYPTTNIDADPRSVWSEPWSNFWGSMPDCKAPVMDGTVTFGPEHPNWPTEWLTEWTPREYWTYQEDSPIFPPAQKTIISDLKTHFLERPCMEEEEPEGRSVAWTVAFAGAREGDLVGVIENEGRLLFVWRTADEDLAAGEGSQIHTTDEDLFVGSEIWGPFNDGMLIKEWVHPQGHIGFTWYRDDGTGSKTRTYLYTDWGYWYEYDGDSGDPFYPGVYHNGEISLGNGVIPLIAFDVNAETFYDDI
jgi:hypothetical protein